MRPVPAGTPLRGRTKGEGASQRRNSEDVGQEHAGTHHFCAQAEKDMKKTTIKVDTVGMNFLGGALTPAPVALGAFGPWPCHGGGTTAFGSAHRS